MMYKWSGLLGIRMIGRLRIGMTGRLIEEYALIADTPLIDDDASNPEPNSLYCLKSSISTMQNIFQISNNEYIPCWLLTGNNVHILDYCELTES